jgi:Protein of unknown function (DUF2971)
MVWGLKVTPPRLYKYEPFNEQSLKNLKAQGIYFGSPVNFNDPYDCALHPVICQPSDNDVEAVRTCYLNHPLSKAFAKKFLAPTTKQLREMLIRSGYAVITDAQENFKQRGVSCFSEVNNDLLMWSHYGDKYKGFCLEFNTSQEPFQKARKVQYSSMMPVIDVATLLLHNSFEVVMDLFSTKSNSWAYEQEWRVIHAQAGTFYIYPPDCLTGVFFGPEMSAEAREIICLILQGQNPNVKFWLGRRSRTEFKVEFEEVIYTPHLKKQEIKP